MSLKRFILLSLLFVIAAVEANSKKESQPVQIEKQTFNDVINEPTIGTFVMYYVI